jgi:hypothetical protein
MGLTHERGAMMAEVKPATDSRLADFRDEIESKPGYYVRYPKHCAREILARLDAAEKRVKELEEELESTADKLSDCWLFLDAVASSDCLLYPRYNAAKLLCRQAAPGWK